ncbi:four helix bundle protein [Opitutaceae bacterium EW11]|nr:four helix bundle protein [Opitutaceae bacterium EW11]
MAHLKLDELVVYRRSEELADHCWNLVWAWDSFARETVGRQLIRAADSIGANIAEGFGRASTADNQRFVRIARGSLYEVRHFLRRADARGLVGEREKKRLREITCELPRLLNGYLRSLKCASVVAEQGP